MKRVIGKIKRAAIGIITDKREGYAPISVSASRLEIAKSFEKRPVYAYQFGEGRMAVLITGGIHGNEVGTVKLAHSITDWLDHEKVPDGLTVFVVPCLNPDGFLRARAAPDYLGGGRIGRFNARDVDMNRNFPCKSFVSEARWSYGKSYQESVTVYAGEKGASEPEIEGICRFIRDKNITTWLSLHNAGRDVMSSSDDTAVDIARQFSDISGYKLLLDNEWRQLGQTGTPKEWCEERGVSFVEIEGSSRWASDWPQLRPAMRAVTSSLAQFSK